MSATYDDDLFGAVRQAWRFARHYGRAVRVRTREELDRALQRAPRYIAVEGNEALRAYAASLAYRGGQEAAQLEEAQPLPGAVPSYIMVPTVGRIRDGYRQRQAGPERRQTDRGRSARTQMQAGMGTVLAASIGLVSAILIEWLSWPATDPDLVRGPHHAAQPPRHGVELPLPTHAAPPPPPTFWEQVAHIATPILAVIALAAVAVLIWNAIGPGRPVRVSWRVDYRIQGRLVIRRVRTRVA